jgi:hypothetical protein
MKVDVEYQRRKFEEKAKREVEEAETLRKQREKQTVEKEAKILIEEANSQRRENERETIEAEAKTKAYE